MMTPPVRIMRAERIVAMMIKCILVRHLVRMQARRGSRVVVGVTVVSLDTQNQQGKYYTYYKYYTILVCYTPVLYTVCVLLYEYVYIYSSRSAKRRLPDS